MLRTRFHGRGGHGIKTASRIVGTAAFLAGYQAQDSPVYGAERRGAAITAFTRISQSPILERGLIDRPDLIVVGDETLLDDSTAAVLVGQESASAVFVNCEGPKNLAVKYGIRPRLVTLDLTGITLMLLGRAAALSAGVAAAAARLLGQIPEDRTIDAVREELEYLELSSELIEKNVRVARQVFAAISPVQFLRAELPVGAQIYSMAYDDPVRGTPSILAPGNSLQRRTGRWRVERPEINRDVCTRCGICFVRCPDGAISLDDEGYPVIDYDHCKGCGICWQQCPISGISRRKEVRAWS